VCAGADAERELLTLAREIDDLESVIVQAGVDFDVGNGVLHGQHIADIRNRMSESRGLSPTPLAQNFLFRFVRGIAHFDAHQKNGRAAIPAGISAVMLDGILRGDHEKGCGSGASCRRR